jgi:hypothetical protein
MSSKHDKNRPRNWEGETELVKKKIKKSSGKYFSSPSDFDDRGVISGNKKSIKSSDAEAFPDEPEEYRPEERKPRPIPAKK